MDRNNQDLHIKILYANANGITGKTTSLKSILKETQSDIAVIVETKTKKPPNIDGYIWYHKPRPTRTGGGVGILIKQQLHHNTQEVPNDNEENQELIWIRIQTTTRPIFLGAYYGPQEKADRDSVYREYQKIRTTINHLKDKGDIIIIGDYNAKIQINHPTYQQETSRNGTLLTQLIEDTNTQTPTTSTETIHWTRENRNNPNEKSIIDYVITDTNIAKQISEIKIDDTGLLTLRGKKETDHNTITLTLKRQTTKPKDQPIKIWADGSPEAWKAFNTKLNTLAKQGIPDYTTLENTILKSLTQDIGTITIRKTNKPKESKRIKHLRKLKSIARKLHDKAINQNQPPRTIQALTNDYIRKRTELRQAIHAEETIITRTKINRLIKEGGTNSKNFWKIRKKLMKNNTNEANVINDQGEEIKDPETAKEHIASYYENLYQARPGDPIYEHHTKTITDKIKQLRDSTKNNIPIPFTKEELNIIIKNLHKHKAPGPDKIPNTALTEANAQTKELYLKVFNNIAKTREIPKQWLKGEVIRLYKGKGTKGRCCNERGITLSSNMGKTFERLLNNRILTTIRITSNQAGGRKGMSTTDHILKIKELINHNKMNKENTYITFLDVTKAYDKAWLDAIMYVMNKQGCEGATWNLTDHLNQNLTATIRTKHGMTRPIKINNSIKQGGVLAVTQYATLMDEINKEINKAKDTTQYNIDTNSTCLLWVDDVAIITNNIEDQQTLLSITNTTANKYRIQFGQEKSKLLIIGKDNTNPTIKLGDMTIDPCETYKYLGETLNTKNNINDHIKEIERKTEAALQSALYIAGDDNYQGIEMETIWTLIESCIIPIITYGSETWDINQNQTKRLNRILDNIIKRILNLPQSTPRECLYYELGTLDIEHRIITKRINYATTLLIKNPDNLRDILKTTNPKSWIQKTRQQARSVGLDLETLRHISAKDRKLSVKESTTKTMNDKHDTEGQNKSKFKFLTTNSGTRRGAKPSYLYKLPKEQARAIFIARTRMIKVKTNYKNMYTNTICRGCGLKEETQQHVLEECTSIHTQDNLITTTSQLFSNDPTKTKPTSNKLTTLLKTIYGWEQA